MRSYAAAIFLIALLLSGCSLFTTPEPNLLRLATIITEGEKIQEPFGLAYRKGELFVSDGEAGVIWKIGSDGKKTLHAGGLGTPSHIAFDDQGYLLVADSGKHTIKRIRAGGDVEIVAGVEGKPGYADGNANEALFRAPIGIAFIDGAIYVADTYNDRIRVIRKGQVKTVAGSVRGFGNGVGADARFNTPTGIIATKDKRLLVADTGNECIRSLDADGNVSTVVGPDSGGAVADLSPNPISEPAAFAISEKGDIFFTDLHSVKVIRKEHGAFETVSATERGYSDSAQSEPRSFNRPTGLAIGSDGELYVADSDNQAIRVFSLQKGKVLSPDEVKSGLQTVEEFRKAAPPRWPYEPPDAPRDIAGTLGEIRGAVDKPDEGLYFHNGLDIAGAYGEKAYFVRTEKVLRPLSAANFGTLRELVRTPTMGYIHIRLGRDQNDNPFGDPRFIFDETQTEQGLKLTDLRIPRGAKFEAGEVVGTLNAMNHVHLIAGRSGDEFNALGALELPGVSDKIAPVIVTAAITDASEQELKSSVLTSASKVKAVVEAYDRMDGNAEKRRLGVYKAGFQIVTDGAAASVPAWNIVFDGNPEESWVPLAYAPGSSSGATGTTVFRYFVTNSVSSASAKEGFLPLDGLAPGKYILRVFVGDFFGNVASKDIQFEIR